MIGTLTARELQVLDLVSRGVTNQAIARRLSVSESAVRWNVHRTLVALAARNRAHAVRIAIERGLIAVPGVVDLAEVGA